MPSKKSTDVTPEDSVPVETHPGTTLVAGEQNVPTTTAAPTTTTTDPHPARPVGEADVEVGVAPTTTACIDINLATVACDTIDPCLASPVIACTTFDPTQRCLDIQHNVVDCSTIDPCLASPAIACTTFTPATTVAEVGVANQTLPSTGTATNVTLGIAGTLTLIGAGLLRKVRHA